MNGKAISIIVLSIFNTFLHCDGQGTYESLSELADGLRSGHIVTANIDVEKCMTNIPPDGAHFNINVALRHWWIQNPASSSPDTRVLHVSDYFKGSESDVWALRDIEATGSRVEGQATWFHANNPNDTDVYLQSCTFGEGAQFHKMTGELDETILVTSYEMLKAELLFGRHVVAVVDLHKCSGGSLPSEIREYTFGMNVWSFLFVDEGSADESLRIYSNFMDDTPNSAPSSRAINSFGIIVNNKRLSSINVTHGAYDIQDGSSVSSFSSEFTCSDTAVSFYTRRYERDGTYNTYADLKTAVEAGHQVEIVNFAKYCTSLIDPEEPMGNNIRGQKFDSWGWLANATEPVNHTDHREAFVFFNDVLSPSGIFNLEEVVVYPDDSLHVNSLSVPYSNSTEPPFEGSEHCYLGGSTVFHANIADKSPVTSYSQLKSRFMNLGAIFEAEIFLSKCYDAPERIAEDRLGFIMWESFLINEGQTTEPPGFEGVSFSLVEDLSTPDDIDRISWVARSVWIDESEEAQLLIKVFDSRSYEVLESYDVRCGLNVGLFLYQYYL